MRLTHQVPKRREITGPQQDFRAIDTLRFGYQVPVSPLEQRAQYASRQNLELSAIVTGQQTPM